MFQNCELYIFNEKQNVFHLVLVSRLRIFLVLLAYKLFLVTISRLNQITRVATCRKKIYVVSVFNFSQFFYVIEIVCICFLFVLCYTMGMQCALIMPLLSCTIFHCYCSYSVGTVVTYNCYSGYVINGTSADITCQANRTWTSPLPRCVSKLNHQRQVFFDNIKNKPVQTFRIFKRVNSGEDFIIINGSLFLYLYQILL